MRYFFVILFSLFVIPLVSFAFDNSHLQKLKSLNQCQKCDLSDANLEDANLTGANLSGANLSKTNLTGVNLRNLYI